MTEEDKIYHIPLMLDKQNSNYREINITYNTIYEGGPEYYLANMKAVGPIIVRELEKRLKECEEEEENPGRVGEDGQPLPPLKWTMEEVLDAMDGLQRTVKKLVWRIARVQKAMGIRRGKKEKKREEKKEEGGNNVLGEVIQEVQEEHGGFDQPPVEESVMQEETFDMQPTYEENSNPTPVFQPVLLPLSQGSLPVPPSPEIPQPKPKLKRKPKP